MQYIYVFFFSLKKIIKKYVLLSIQTLLVYSLALESGIFLLTNAKIINTPGIH
jgi:hypothetical protein